MDTRIITLMPTRGFVLAEAESALDRELAANMQSPVIIRTHDLPLPLSRNFLVETALKIDDWTHALLLDDDVILPKGALQEMLKIKADVVTMNYPMHGKIDGKFPGVIAHDKDGSIAFAGLGATLVKREVFEIIEQPWFCGTQYRIERAKDGTIGFFVGQQDGRIQTSAGEDTYFYLQCRKYGIKVKETKKRVAAHARIDRMVTTSHAQRYFQQHVITKNDKVERELL